MRSLRIATLLMLLISLSSIIAGMLTSVILSKLLLGWIVISSCLIVLSTLFIFLLMHASLELLLARVSLLFALTVAARDQQTHKFGYYLTELEVFPIRSTKF